MKIKHFVVRYCGTCYHFPFELWNFVLTMHAKNFLHITNKWKKYFIYLKQKKTCYFIHCLFQCQCHPDYLSNPYVLYSSVCLGFELKVSLLYRIIQGYFILDFGVFGLTVLWPSSHLILFMCAYANIGQSLGGCRRSWVFTAIS